MADAIECRGKDNILSLFRFHTKNGKVPYYRLLHGKKVRMSFTEDDQDGENVLEQQLSYLEKADTNGSYELQFFDQKSKTGSFTNIEPVSSFTFVMKERDQVQPYNQAQPVQPAANPFQDIMNKQFSMFMEKQLMLLQRIDELQANPVTPGEEPEPEPDQVQKVIGYVHDALDHPIAERMIAGIFKKFNIPWDMEDTQQQFDYEASSISGVPGEVPEQLQLAWQAVQELYKIDPDIGTALTKLAVLAKKKPKQYAMAKMML